MYILSIQYPLFPFSWFFSAIQVFDNAGIANFLDAVLDGYHATVFAYGPGPGLGKRLVDRAVPEESGLAKNACNLQRLGDPGNFG